MKYKFFIFLITLFILAGCSKTQTNVVKPKPENLIENQQTSTAANEGKKDANISNEEKSIAQSKVVAKQKQSESKEFTVKLVITKDSNKEILLDKSVKLSSGISALKLLKENAKVYEEGGFIKSINGIESIPPNKLTDEDIQKGILGYDWFIYLNGKKTSVGAKDIILKNGDIINFDYKGWTMEDLAP